MSDKKRQGREKAEMSVDDVKLLAQAVFKLTGHGVELVFVVDGAQDFLAVFLHHLHNLQLAVGPDVVLGVVVDGHQRKIGCPLILEGVEVLVLQLI